MTNADQSPIDMTVYHVRVPCARLGNTWASTFT